MSLRPDDMNVIHWYSLIPIPFGLIDKEQLYSRFRGGLA
jgi:hypothetical protein